MTILRSQHSDLYQCLKTVDPISQIRRLKYECNKYLRTRPLDVRGLSGGLRAMLLLQKEIYGLAINWSGRLRVDLVSGNQPMGVGQGIITFHPQCAVELGCHLIGDARIATSTTDHDNPLDAADMDNFV